MALPAAAKHGDRISVGIRPEHMALDGRSGPRLAATADLIERLGETGYAHLRLSSGQMLISEIRGDPAHKSGDSVTVALDPRHTHLFDSEGRRLS
jgi:multiple sugar transport system ATP-binding protein